jgi:hypothetical protein
MVLKLFLREAMVPLPATFVSTISTEAFIAERVMRLAGSDEATL